MNPYQNLTISDPPDKKFIVKTENIIMKGGDGVNHQEAAKQIREEHLAVNKSIIEQLNESQSESKREE